MNTDPIIQVQGLNVAYSDHRAVRDVSVAIPARQITAIIGPSGCGKTTLLRSMCRLVELTPGVRVWGQIFFAGQDIYAPDVDVTDVRKRIGLLAQRPFPLPMSIYDNVAYGPRLYGIRKREVLDALVQKQLQAAGIWEEVKDRLNAPASALSIGQQQRLCLARGLAVEPEVLLCDEITSALDPLSSQRIEGRLLELKTDYSIVMVTHVLRQARRLADYVIFMYMGELIEHGPAEQVLHNPQEAKTRAYLAGEFY
ncbi:MAG TPA: phosphate ABC transporter ATP-binding protein [Anaerolineae bacterium]|nr:phosphate ABC transporter ATP-binding protein [Anaerolineae bacterium]HQH37290.1 phosphate ABC transporter ATP-binding protein [Anaerolineae bacterium]